jgi:deoxyribose-phosphate aldolase
MNIAEYIDHTLLKPDANLENILQVCTEAQEFGFAAVCIPPFYVNSAFRALESGKQKVQIATVVGFPLGYSSTAAKVEEVKRALEDGADEIDAVINLCAIKSQSWAHVRNDLDSMVMATRMRGKKIKIILAHELDFLPILVMLRMVFLFGLMVGEEIIGKIKWVKKSLILIFGKKLVIC